MIIHIQAENTFHENLHRTIVIYLGYFTLYISIIPLDHHDHNNVTPIQPHYSDVDCLIRLINYLIWSNQIHHMTADRQNKPITTYRPGPTQTGKRYPTGIANAGDDNKSISDSGESSR